MRPRKRAFWIVGIVVILVSTVVVLSILLHRPDYPAITLSEDHLLSFAGYKIGTEPFLYLQGSPVSRIFWKRVVYQFPRYYGFLKKWGIIKPVLLSTGNSADDVTFWIQIKRASSYGSKNSISSLPLSDNLVQIEICDPVTKQTFKASRSGFVPGGGANMRFTSFQVDDLRKFTTKIDLVVYEENDQGIMEELATWKVEIP